MDKATLCVGADIHLEDILLRGVDKASAQEVLPPLRVTNNRPGAQAAIAAIAQVARQGGYSRLQIGWEATGMLWIPFQRFLSTSPLLRPFDLQLVCFNPKLVANFKEGLVLRRPKNDDRDTSDIAARLRFGQLPVSYFPTDFWQGLRRLTRYRFRLARDLCREKMRFRATAFLKCSDWARLPAFADLCGVTSAALLTEFTAAELRTMSHQQLAEQIARRGHGRFHDPAATARAVQEVLSTSYPLDPHLDLLLTATLAASWEHIRFLQRLIRRLDQQIARHIAPLPNPLLTVKGLGAVITAGLLAEIVDISRFPEHKHLAQYSGLSWPQRSSGHFVAQDTRLSKVGNTYLRYYFILGADRLRQYDLEYKAFYWRKYQEVTKHQHKRALVLTARKLVRLVHALLTKNVPYVRPQMPTRLQEDEPLL